MNSKALPISLVVITLNEEANIKRCIQSASFCAEIIVVDSQSPDKTVAIAESLGAKVFTRPFEGYRDQKQWASNAATQPWILSLDADEELSPDLAEEITNLIAASPEYDAYRMPRCSFHLNRWIKHGGWYPDYQLRLFKKAKSRWVGGAVHEHVSVDGSIGTLKNDLHHFVFKNLEDQIDTNNDYSSRGALTLLEKHTSFLLPKMIFKPLGKFLECYIWKQGFRDGDAGLIIALGAAQSMFLKYAKAWEKRV